MTKKKLIITITSLCLVVVAAVAAVVGIVAATQVNITSSLTVTYTPDASVIATVAGNYQVENGDPAQIGSHNYVYGQKQANTDTINLTETIKLNDTNKYVVFEFSFTNNAEEGNSNSQKLDVTVDGIPAAQNMKVTTMYSASKIAALTKTEFEKINSEASAATLLQDITRGNTAYMYILVERTAGIQGSWTASSIAFTLGATA